MGFEIKNDRYYVAGMSEHGHKMTHIQKFTGQ